MAATHGYRIDLQLQRDRETGRERIGRFMCLVVSVVAIFGAPMALIGYWGQLVGQETVGTLIGFLLGIWLAARFVPTRMLIYNPEWTAYVSQNVLTGTMVPYGPGLHCSYWWEQRNQSGIYSLKIITRDFTVTVATQSATMTVEGKFEYCISLRHIVRAIGIDESTIERGITAFVKSFLVSVGSALDAEGVRTSIVSMNERLAAEFMTAQGAATSGNFESTYGFITVSIVVDNITFPAEARKTRDAVDKAATMHRVIANLYGITPAELSRQLSDKEISLDEYNKMLNRAMATAGDATLGITVVEADVPALLGKVAEQLVKKGGPA